MLVHHVMKRAVQWNIRTRVSVDVKEVGSLTVVQRTSKRGRDTRFGTRRCAFGDEPYGVAESYSREGVNVEVNSSRSPK
ncbi:hypothetical protein PIB30_048083 [Stylosanthes scabra]|uniref:Uncharacterized protein n=1 Tax=Stylosanthes scabra TaxID=79078 RepID=A0ABU6VEY1_9FABA|nr:hypothetical protein [Stylosanthes scabra]